MKAWLHNCKTAETGDMYGFDEILLHGWGQFMKILLKFCMRARRISLTFTVFFAHIQWRGRITGSQATLPLPRALKNKLTLNSTCCLCLGCYSQYWKVSALFTKPVQNQIYRVWKCCEYISSTLVEPQKKCKVNETLLYSRVCS